MDVNLTGAVSLIQPAGDLGKNLWQFLTVLLPVLSAFGGFWLTNRHNDAKSERAEQKKLSEDRHEAYQNLLNKIVESEDIDFSTYSNDVLDASLEAIRFGNINPTETIILEEDNNQTAIESLKDLITLMSLLKQKNYDNFYEPATMQEIKNAIAKAFLPPILVLLTDDCTSRETCLP